MATDTMVGLKIKAIRKMTKKELNDEGWEPRYGTAPTAIVFDNGTVVYASQDDEGNGPGSLFGYNKSDGVRFAL